ncbi:TetR/AcrR family transcriptional regulator [Sphingomonas sp. BK580]|uniref:TetR/AcrR family transcriptional regulator n=1 Tax=Sphingomonas sp. BK580 TaxID=2586972 RepID=UPI001790D822|nr:TetR/AcrR family transcriptional regulator [Sphingomonas sp. BK580]MBB3695588.1 TetR/AcrR family transcriptional repressor of nem operon [Sphingomonas sp. BK580]
MMDIIDVKPWSGVVRVTKEVAEENRRKILETATTLFKTRGIENVSVADLMKAAGFTHGGFYNHFASKADLAAETVRYAFEQALNALRGASETGDEPTAMTERLSFYLSPEHRDDPAGGCPTGSLPVDVGRQSVDAQKAFAGGIEGYIEMIAGTDQGGTQSRGAAITTLATLVGAIVLSRAVREGDPRLSDEILQAVRG